MAPGERCEVIVDFSAYAPGTEFLLKNVAKAPFPSGEAANPQTVGQIMLFRVVPLTSPDTSVIPSQLTTVTRLSNPAVTRVMTLNEMMHEDDEPLGALLNGMTYHDAPATEFPALGSTEMWEIVNMTGDTHPIHIHLVQFQILDRQRINMQRYERAFTLANPVIPTDSYVPVPVEPYLKGRPMPADANERGWKDTFRMNPGEVTRVLIRFAPQDESPDFAFDATAEPGYVWHCHILEHEENDMMRPLHLVAGGARGSTVLTGAARDAVTPAASVATDGPASILAVDGVQVRFNLSAPAQVEGDLYNVAGKRVGGLASSWYGAGAHTVSWQGAGNRATLGAGVYFVRLVAGGFDITQKVVVAP